VIQRRLKQSLALQGAGSVRRFRQGKEEGESMAKKEARYLHVWYKCQRSAGTNYKYKEVELPVYHALH
jgi:hypothetical protein